jgi:hypothetical protein
MTFALQDHTLLLTFCDVDLSLSVQKLLAAIPFCLHLKFKLAL